MNEYKKMAIRALENEKGDDAYRGKMAFRGLSDTQMNEQYGESGKTLKEILDGYVRRDEKIDEAIKWIEKV